MKIITKKIRVIAMTTEEMRNFAQLIQQAKEGHTSHYAESRLTDGTYLGVQLDPEADVPVSRYPLPPKAY